MYIHIYPEQYVRKVLAGISTPQSSGYYQKYSFNNIVLTKSNLVYVVRL